jgi:putative transposase
MLRTYRYRLYPNPQQQSALLEILEAARWLYNRALDYRRKRWNESRQSVSYYEQAALWKTWRNEQPDENPLRLLNMSAGQQVLRRLDSAYGQFLRGRRGKPRFQGADRFSSLNYKPGDGAKLKNSRLYIQSAGPIKVRWHRARPGGALKNIVVLRRPSGWYGLLQVELPDPPPDAPASANPPAGIDLGLSHALALSDGTLIDSPRCLGQSLGRLRVLQRSVARKSRGSHNRRKAARQLARHHERIASQRRDFWHKTTRQLVNTCGAIALEDLSLSFILRNPSLARAAHDTGLGMFRELLDYKAAEAGVEVITVNPKDTSQVCSGCGCRVPKDLSVRVHHCPECGLTLDRDVNAARNILRLGHRRWALTWPVAACVAQDAPPL